MQMNTPSWLLMIIAIVSALLNFAGFSTVLNNDWYSKALAAMSSLAVFTVIYGFWGFAFLSIPILQATRHRIGAWITVLIGCMGLVAISAYWNVVALAGHELQALALQQTTIAAERQFSDATENAGTYQSLTPQLEALSLSVSSLSESEIQNGAISGTPGEGSISRTLEQISTRVDAVIDALTSAEGELQSLNDQGRACLSEMRLGTTAHEVSGGVDCINAVISGLNNQDVATQINTGLSGLTTGIVLPATVRNDEQRSTIARIFTGIQEQADGIAVQSDAISSTPIGPVSNARPNTVQAVLVHWHAIIPAIATAVAIDLLPVILLIFMVLVRRDAQLNGENTSTITLADIERMHKDLRRIDTLRGDGPNKHTASIRSLSLPGKEGDAI